MIPYLKCLFFGHILDDKNIRRVRYYSSWNECGNTTGFFHQYKVGYKCSKCSKYIHDHKEEESLFFRGDNFYKKEVTIIDD
jgi:hypothetical protein